MKISHIIDSMEIGGAEKLLVQLCHWQRSQGNTVSVYCLAKLGALGEQVRDNGNEVEVGHDTSLPGAAVHAYGFISKHKPDVVHCHNATATIVAAPAARLAGVPSILSTRHGLVAPPYSMRREIKYGLAARCCDWIIGVCDATCRNLAKLPLADPRRIVRVYNGTAAIRFPAVPGRSRQDRFTVVHVGRLTAAKDQSTLLRAFAIAFRSVNKLSLVIVGDGELRSELEQLSSELSVRQAVSFIGEQHNIAPFLINANAFVMSSVSEGLPVSLLEAMSAGLPVVVTDVGGMPEAVSYGATGIVVPAHDAEALAAAILRLAHDPELVKRLGEAGLRRYHKFFRADIMTEEYNRLYSGTN